MARNIGTDNYLKYLQSEPRELETSSEDINKYIKKQKSNDEKKKQHFGMSLEMYKGYLTTNSLDLTRILELKKVLQTLIEERWYQEQSRNGANEY